MDDQGSSEEWREILGTAGKYRISDHGKVTGPQGSMTGFLSKDGYRRVNLQYPHGHQQKVLHKLVAHTFLGEQPSGTEVQLVDGDKLNVSLTNITYVPKGSGAARANGARPPRGKRLRDGTFVPAPRKYVPIGPGRPLRGEECGRARLTEADARDILVAYVKPTNKGRVKKKGPSLQEIAEMYGVARTTVFKLVNGDNWRYLHLQLFGRLPSQETDEPIWQKLTPTEIAEWPTARARIIRQTKATARQAGSVYIGTIKSKELRVENLGDLLDEVIGRQGYRCAQTGVRFDEANADLRASLDRMDSDGHYERGNVQLVTSWYNFAKRKRGDADMLRLLGLHAGLFDSQTGGQSEP